MRLGRRIGRGFSPDGLVRPEQGEDTLPTTVYGRPALGRTGKTPQAARGGGTGGLARDAPSAISGSLGDSENIAGAAMITARAG